MLSGNTVNAAAAALTRLFFKHQEFTQNDVIKNGGIEVSTQEQQLSDKLINIFCIGLSPFMLFMGPVMSYYPYFLTDIAKISATTVGVVLLITRIVDAFAIIFVGGTIERTNLKWGKYISWIYIGAPLTLVFFTLMWVDIPGMAMTAKAAYFTIMYIVGHIFMNFAWSGASSLIPLMSTNPMDRVKLSARRTQFQTVTNLIYSASHMPIIMYFGRNNEGTGYLVYMVLTLIIQLLGYLMSAKVAKPYDITSTAGAETPSFGELLKGIVTNKPLLILMLYGLFNFSILSLANGLNIYVFKYVHNNTLLISLFLTVNSVVNLASSFIGQFIAQKVDSKRTVMIIGTAIAAVSFVGAYFFARNTIVFMLFRWIGALSGMGMVVNFAVYADAADYAEWKTGKSAKALIMSVSSLPAKTSGALVGAITGFGLAAIGYTADAPATPQLVQGLINLSTLLPIACAIIAIFFLSFYKLDNETMKKINEDLAARRAAAQQQA